MKRRDFLATVGAIGALGSSRSRAQAVPCPPPTFAVDGGSSVNTTCTPPGPAPTWFTNMADRTWATPVTNTLNSVKPNPEPPGNSGFISITDAWTGGTSDQERGEYLIAANGGHGDYSGNEVYACALRNNAPAWVRLNNPSSTSGGSDGKGSQMNYGDGSMRSVHGWHRCAFGNNRVWYAGVDGAFASGQDSPAVWSWDRATMRWTYHGQGLPYPSGNMFWEAGCANYDPVSNSVWSVAGGGADSSGRSIFSVDATSGTITRRNIDTDSHQPRWAALAPDLRVWILGCPYQDDLRVVNLDTGAIVTRVPTGSPDGLQDGAGAMYHQPSRAVLLWGGGYGANIRKLSIPSNPMTGTYTWSQVLPAGGSAVTPSQPPSNGAYSKVQLIQDMGNGQSAICLVNSVTGPVYVYKLPAAGV